MTITRCACGHSPTDCWCPEPVYPEIALLLDHPPLFYLKRDRDRWLAGLDSLTERGVVLW